MERTLLLVDDEENILTAMTRLLRRDGYRLLTANSAQTALSLLKENEVGVIVSDQRMPQVTGVEFLSQVKDLYPDTVRMVLSGYSDISTIFDAVNRGAIYKFLTKPWDDELLRDNIREAFARHELRNENKRLAEELRKANAELSDINRELELRVEQRTRLAVQSLGSLRVAQEVLEHLPLAVIGVDTEGVVVVANGSARTLTDLILGEPARDQLPSEVLAWLETGDATAGEQGTIQLNGRCWNIWRHGMGRTSSSQGQVVVLAPQPEGR